MIAAVALLAALASPSPAPPTVDPYAIYTAAMRHLATLKQPAYIDDTEHWTVVQFAGGQETTSEHFQRTIFNSVYRRENVLFLPLNPKQTSLIGPSYFAPDTWLIGKRPTPPPAPQSVPNMAPDLSDLKMIASVVSVAKPSYDIRLAGIDPLTGGGTAYHLVLHPLSNPQLHNLRELWINTATEDIMRAEIDGVYRPTKDQLLQQTLVFEDFGRVGPYWLVIHHVWTYDEPFAGVRFQYNATSMQMRFPKTVPGWFFDEAAFAQHRGDVTSALESTP